MFCKVDIWGRGLCVVTRTFGKKYFYVETWTIRKEGFMLKRGHLGQRVLCVETFTICRDFVC